MGGYIEGFIAGWREIFWENSGKLVIISVFMVKYFGKSNANFDYSKADTV